MPGHPIAVAFLVVALATAVALLPPWSGMAGFFKKSVLCFVGLSLLMFLGAVFGTVLRDFLLEMK
jgi:hypothetical protein